MAADVEEGTQHTVGAASHQDRLTGVVMDDEVARLAQLAREANDDRILAEQQVDLAPETRGIVVAFDRGVADARTIVTRVSTHHVEHTLEISDLISVLHSPLLDRVPAI
jgi:hypothetical protein